MSVLSARRLRAVTLAAPPGLAERLFAHAEADFFWDGSVGLGRAAKLDGSLEEIRRRAAALHATIDGPAPPLFGGLAFSPGFSDESWSGFGDASFVLPRWLYRDGTLTYTGAGAPPAAELRALLEPPAAPSPPPRVDAAERDPAAYQALARAARAEILAGRAEKIVVARRTTLRGRFDDAAIVQALPRSATRFAFRRGGATFLGATPERLLRKIGLEVVTEAIAGTSASGSFGDKDRAEHAPVVHAITAALAAAGARPELSPAAPRVLPDLAHLVTPIRARLAAPVHILELAAALHPTPAVGGTPRARAVELIRAREAPRGWYTGAVGWFDAAGDGELFVALRCALITSSTATLHAGAGIVAASSPEAEYEETLLKERSMLRALGAA